MMVEFTDSDNTASKGRAKIWKVAVYSVIFLVFIFILAIFQTSPLKFFGQSPDMLLALVCAIGFVFGRGYGAIFGLIAGITASLLGATGFSLTPILYVICGFLCGELISRFLSPNLVSFMVFGIVAGILREIFTLIHFGLISENISLWQLINNVIIGEYLAYLVCLIPAYFTIFTVHLLFKGKDDKSR